MKFDKITMHPESGNATVCRECPACKKKSYFIVTSQEAWDIIDNTRGLNDKKIQDILPNNTPTEREILLSGFCPKCQEEVFGKDEG